MPEPLPDIRALDILVTVAQRGSISAAADVHRISQPAASMRLRSLEQALGMTLLERLPTGSRLTPAGEVAVGWASEVVKAVENLMACAAAVRREERTRLRVAASMTVAEYLLPSWIRQLGNEDPDLAVSLQMGNTARVAELVGSLEVDLGFVEGLLPPAGLHSRPLGHDDLVLVVSPDHPWARRQVPLSATEVAATPVVVREQGSGTRETFAEALREHGLEVRPLMQLGSTTAIKAAAVAGTGPAVLSGLAVQTELRSRQLVVVASELQLGRTIRAVWAPSRRLSPASQRLLDIAAASV
jgi:DNA-binding transcriptional LysR family regulator